MILFFNLFVMGHGSAGIYLSSFPEKLVSGEDLDKKLNKIIKESKRKEFIDKMVNKIIKLFTFKKAKSE